MVQMLVRHIIKLVLCLLLAGRVSGGQSPQATLSSDEHLVKGRAAYLKNDFETAKKELQQALASRKEVAEPQFLLGMIAWHEGKPGDAIKFVSEAIKVQPQYPEAHYVLGKLYFEKRDWKKAEAAAIAASRQGAEFANLQVLLGDALLLQGQRKEALVAYEQALKAPAPNSDVTPELHARIEAVKNLMEIMAHRNDSQYVLPQPIKDKNFGQASLSATGLVRIVGVLNENGDYKPFALASTDAVPGQVDVLLGAALSYKFKPATIKGRPVLFWLILEYNHSGSFFRR